MKCIQTLQIVNLRTYVRVLMGVDVIRAGAGLIVDSDGVISHVEDMETIDGLIVLNI